MAPKRSRTNNGHASISAQSIIVENQVKEVFIENFQRYRVVANTRKDCMRAQFEHEEQDIFYPFYVS